MENAIRERFAQIGDQLRAVGTGAVSYVFFADAHLDEYLRRDDAGRLRVYEDAQAVERRIARFIGHLEEAVRFVNAAPEIDFIAMGGDMLNAYSIRGKQAVLDTLNRALSPLQNCRKPVVLAFGNHDDNGFQTLNPDIPALRPAWLISDMDWQKQVLDRYPGAADRVHDERYPYSKYYYMDLPEKSTRIIVLDTMDMRKPFDATGTVTDMTNRLPRFWYTDQQLDWLCRRALCAPDGWDYILISHMGIQQDTSDNCLNGDKLRAVLKAFQRRSAIAFAYTDTDGSPAAIEADFSHLRESRLLLYSFGHQHAELVHYSADIDLWQVATGCENAWGGGGAAAGDKSLPWVYMTDRTEGTERETCFDVFSVRREIGYKFNVGPGRDAVMPR